MATNAIDLITADHEQFRRLFAEFEQATSAERQQRAAREVLPLLEAHSRMEEEIFYPALRSTDDAEAAPRMLRSFEEHALQDRLVAELMTMPPDDDFTAKMAAMIDASVIHMREEEEHTLPLAERVLGDQLERLGEEMAARREQVLASLAASGAA